MVDIGTTIATIKAIAGVAKAAGQIELYNQVINLQQTILELIGDNTRAVQENSQLTRELGDVRDKVASLEALLLQRGEMVFQENVYWRVLSGSTRDGPFCPACLDGNGKAARLINRSDDHWWRCPVCESTVEKPGSDPAPVGKVLHDWDPLRQ